jgi:phosphoglycolate phosphatase-like HAD superfamily hydrolase
MINPKWIFLDFDGVIMDSMLLKLDAYCFALAEFGFTREAVLEEQLKYAGLSRSRAVPLMFRGLAGREVTGDEAARILTRFAEEDIRLRPQMHLLPGVEGFLREAGRREVPLAVVTGTPQEVIDGTVNFFDIRQWFREVHGYPPAKPEHLQGLLTRHGLRPDEALYVGDSIIDIRSANEVGIPFIGVNRGDDPFAGMTMVAEVKGLGEVAGLLGWRTSGWDQ